MIDPQDVTAAQRSLGAHLARLREAAGYTQTEFAPKVFISRSSVANIETGHSRGTRDFWTRADEVLQAGGALVTGYEEVARLVARQRQEAADAAAGARSAVVAHVADREPTFPALGDAMDDNARGPRGAVPSIDLTDGKFISVPVHAASGVIAYLITRRENLVTLVGTIPGLALPGHVAASVASVTARPADVSDLLVPSGSGDHSRSSFVTVTQLLASQRQAVAPDALLSLVEAHRDSLAMLFQKAGSDPVRGDIGALLGEASIVASRLWSAKGNRSLAVAHCAFARQLADNLSNPILGAIARIFESNLRSAAATLIGAEGDVLLGLRMLEEAAAVERHLSPAARARIAAEQAQAYAVLKLRRECQEALDRARRSVDEIDETDRTGLFSDWNSSRLLVYEGTCQLFLSEGEKAVGALNQAVRLLETDQANVNVLLAARVDLASAYAEYGELDEGCKLLGETYVQLLDMGNRRGIERARRARERLVPRQRERAVRELDERMMIYERQRDSEPDDC